MSLDKAIKHGKEKRKIYRKAKAIDCTCRNHGSCSYCRDNRTRFDTYHRNIADEKINDWKKGECDFD